MKLKFVYFVLITLLSTIPGQAAVVPLIGGGGGGGGSGNAEVRGDIYDEALSHFPAGANATGTPGNVGWDAYNFPGFWYDIETGSGSEKLAISNLFSRTIQKSALVYSTQREIRRYKAINSSYYSIGFFGDEYLAINGSPIKLALVLPADQDFVLLNGTGYYLDGWELRTQEVNNISREVRILLKYNGTLLDDSILREGEAYTYIQSSFAGERDVPLFVTFAENISAGQVRFRDTWAVSRNALIINAGNNFGIFEVIMASQLGLFLENTDMSIDLSKDSNITLYSNFKLKIADSDVLRFHPFIEKKVSEIKGEVYDEERQHFPNQSPGISAAWDAYNFPGFWYDLKDGMMSESLKVYTDNLTARLISNASGENMEYSTERRLLMYEVSRNTGLPVERALDANGNKVFSGNYYARLGFLGEERIALNGKAQKLSRLIREDGAKASDKKTLTVNETWDIGGGWTIKAQSIDARAVPRQVWLVLSYNGTKLDDRVASQGSVYTYVEKSIAGESDVPVFATYIDAIFAGATTDMVQLRYTWAIAREITEVRAGGRFGSMEITEASGNKVVLSNHAPINLSMGSIVDIAENLKFRIADSTDLRFYPFVNVTAIENQLPVAIAGPDRTASVGDVVHFNASASYDPDGFITGYAWDFGDNQATITGEMMPKHAYTSPGVYMVKLTVTDNQGASSTGTAVITVTGTGYLRGDMNCNNRTDTGDATLVLRDVVGLPIPRCWE